uniref:Bm1285, isoform b n=1 Tax=Brugia malayi TaxID=6279 RepID=A0A1I9G1R1_BRUMA|nr:Bm1285, isoform b [Brugia malayi]
MAVGCKPTMLQGSFEITERIARYMLFAPLHVFFCPSPSLATKCRESRSGGICLRDSLSAATRQRCSLTWEVGHSQSFPSFFLSLAL